MDDTIHYRNRGERHSRGFTKMLMQLALARYPGVPAGYVRGWVQKQMGPIDPKTFRRHLDGLVAQGRIAPRGDLLGLEDPLGILRDVMDYLTGDRPDAERAIFLIALEAAKEGLIQRLKERWGPKDGQSQT